MSAPETIGKYHVLDLVGTGGFGKVFRARDPYLNRDVAIKLCALEDPEQVERFAREAKISASLHHPHIVTVHDFGYSDGRPYLVQELLAGRDLEEIVRSREWLPYPFRFRVLLQVADAVRYAHSQGVVHRDIKPDNIRVLPDGSVKVMDFGIARVAHAGSRLTGAGMSLGTIGYLAPEQIRGEDVDGRADVFSYGVLTYELLSYRRPFHAEPAFTVLHQILQVDPAPLSEVWPDCPQRIEACVMRCLARDCDDRYAGFDVLLPELADAFREAAATGALPTAPPPGARPAAVEEASAQLLERNLELSQTEPLPGVRLSSPEPAPPADSGARSPEVESGPVGRPLAAPSTPSTAAWGDDRIPSESYDTALRRTSGRRLLVAAAGVIVVLALGLVLGIRLREPSAVREAAVQIPPPPPSFGVLRVEARPWARIEGIRDAEGESWPLDGVSPLRVELPSGSYSVVVSHPSFEGPWLCRVEVTGERESRCEVVLPTMTSQEYFRRVGWYR